MDGKDARKGRMEIATNETVNILGDMIGMFFRNRNCRCQRRYCVKIIA